MAASRPLTLDLIGAQPCNLAAAGPNLHGKNARQCRSSGHGCSVGVAFYPDTVKDHTLGVEQIHPVIGHCVPLSVCRPHGDNNPDKDRPGRVGIYSTLLCGEDASHPVAALPRLYPKYEIRAASVAKIVATTKAAQIQKAHPGPPLFANPQIPLRETWYGSADCYSQVKPGLVTGFAPLSHQHPPRPFPAPHLPRHPALIQLPEILLQPESSGVTASQGAAFFL
jgi:hypothetical protein